MILVGQHWELLTGGGETSRPPAQANPAGAPGLDDDLNLLVLLQDPPEQGHLLRQLLLGVETILHSCFGQTFGVSILAAGTEESFLTEALLARSRGGFHVDTLAVGAAVLVLIALDVVLTNIAVEQRLAATPPDKLSSLIISTDLNQSRLFSPVVCLAAATAGLEKFVLPGENVHVRTGPELVFLPPLGGLSDQPDGAVHTLQVGRQLHLVALGPETRRYLTGLEPPDEEAKVSRQTKISLI